LHKIASAFANLGPRLRELVMAFARAGVAAKSFVYERGWHPRKKGPGIHPTRGHRTRSLLTTAERREEFAKVQRTPDAPKRASRTMPSSWIGQW
jgi:hypothetical protein